jgi:hypothetical protein
MKMVACKFTVVTMVVALLAPVNKADAQGRPDGTGIVLNSITGISLPLVGEVGTIIIDQVVVTDLALVRDLAGQIVGLEAAGTLTGTLSATGMTLVDEQFTSTVAITSSGPGQCEFVGIDLGRLTLDGLGLVTVDAPEAALTGRGSGAVGSLLCNVGNLLSGPTGLVTRGVQGLVNAINRVI